MPDFVAEGAERLREFAESELAKLFAPGGPVPDDGIPPSLAEPLRYAILGGGKRLRPVLCLATCEALCGRAEPALPAALAVEVLHNYTLVHDDLKCMDDDALRRGRPSVHAKYGEAQAVLVGDALQAAAFRLALMAPPGCAEALALAAGPSGVVGGQWIDVTSAPPHDAARVRYVHERKTAALIVCACETGAISAGAPERGVAAARRYGAAFGLAFQIVDDLLDAEDPAKAGELSILRVASRDEARAAARAATTEAVAALDGFEPSVARDILRSLAEGQLRRSL